LIAAGDRGIKVTKMSANTKSARSASADGRANIGLLTRLQLERSRIADELDAAKPGPEQQLAAGWQDRDSPSEDEVREMEYSHIDALHLRLNQIEQALQRVADGCYGRCLRCNGRIGERRLSADPAVVLCKACQSAAEAPGRTPTSL
jgi:RNA polymerase-binding transcription factor